jgi:hypothetical protein
MTPAFFRLVTRMSHTFFHHVTWKRVNLAGVSSCPGGRYSGLVTASLAGVSSCPPGRYSGLVTASLVGVSSCPRGRYSGLVSASLAGVSSCPRGRYSGCQRAWRERDVTTQSYSGERPTEMRIFRLSTY